MEWLNIPPKNVVCDEFDTWHFLDIGGGHSSFIIPILYQDSVEIDRWIIQIEKSWVYRCSTFYLLLCLSLYIIFSF